MQKKETITVETNGAIILCQIIDEFEDFNNQLINLLKGEKNKIGLSETLEKISHGKFCFAPEKIKNFYLDNKNVIDKINQYSNIEYFISDNYHLSYWDGKIADVDYKNYQLLNHILNNKGKLDKIIAVLEKLKELGFSSFEFSENLDYSDESYSVYKSISNNRYDKIRYLDNLEVIPSYQQELVKYKTTGSNYKIIIGVSLFGNLAPYKIMLNNLIFDANRLPKTISKEETFDKIINLSKEKKKEYSSIKNSVDLSVGITDLCLLANDINEKINSFDDVKQKQELIELLSGIKENILKMQLISNEYDQEIINDNEFITETLLANEKKEYVKRRENYKNFIL